MADCQTSDPWTDPIIMPMPSSTGSIDEHNAFEISTLVPLPKAEPQKRLGCIERSGAYFVPPEIALSILENCDDISSAIAISQVSRSFKSSFEHYKEKILSPLLREEFYTKQDCLRHALFLDTLLQFEASASEFRISLTRVQAYSAIMGNGFRWGRNLVGPATGINEAPWSVDRVFEYYKAVCILRKWHLQNCERERDSQKRDPYVHGLKHFYLHALSTIAHRNTYQWLFLDTLPSTSGVCECIPQAMEVCAKEIVHEDWPLPLDETAKRLAKVADIIQMAHLLVICRPGVERRTYALSILGEYTPAEYQAFFKNLTVGNSSVLVSRNLLPPSSI